MPAVIPFQSRRKSHNHVRYPIRKASHLPLSEALNAVQLRGHPNDADSTAAYFNEIETILLSRADDGCRASHIVLEFTKFFYVQHWTPNEPFLIPRK